MRSAIVIAAAALIAAGCQSTKTAIEPTSETTEADSVVVDRSGLELADYRNALSDRFSSQHHDMPDFFMKSHESSQDANRDPFQGFRVQIESNRNIAIADSIARSFRIWSDTTVVNYQPEAYVFFQQPYYRVHVGDFRDRDRANQFSRMVQRRYPSAWVVHDRINPDSVPADTVEIGLQ